MIRFRVVKGSHLLLAISVAALIVVLALLLFVSPPRHADSAARTSNPIQPETEAMSAFASDSASLTVEIIREPASPVVEPRATILIYHTHTHEAYEQVDEDPYVAVEAWRTKDDAHSVVRVGETLSSALESLGYAVVHDETDHELDALSTAYERSLNTIESYGHELDLLIDLHRDAYVDGLESCYTDTAGNEYAQLMLLVGRGDDYLPENRPDYDENLRFAQLVSRNANLLLPGICRNVTVKKSRYNQHLGKHAILVEVGHNRNTLKQAIASTGCLAKAIDSALRS